MFARRCLFLLLGLVFFAACTSDKTAPPPPAEETARAVKTQVDQFLAAAKVQPKSAPKQLALLLESLEARARDDAGRYAGLLDAAKALQTKYQAKANPAEIEQQIDALRQATAKLSG